VCKRCGPVGNAPKLNTGKPTSPSSLLSRCGSKITIPAMPASLASRATMSPVPASRAVPHGSPCSSSSTSQPIRPRGYTLEAALACLVSQVVREHQWQSAGHHMGRGEARACLWRPLNRTSPTSPPPTIGRQASCLTNTFMEDGPIRLCEPARCWSAILLRLASKRAQAGTVEASRPVFVLMCPCAQLWACTRERSKTRVRGRPSRTS
jgi:hypothetical protein